MKKTYGTERELRRIIIKHISDATTRLATKLMACKLMRKCRKEKVPTGVIPAATQCAEGTMLSWAPYLLKLFLEDCKYAEDLGTKFHYSWLLILIYLIRWKESQYTYFCELTSRYRVVQYTSLRSTSDSKSRSENESMFSWYYNDLQESIANTWRITPKVVAQYRDIANFKVTKHTVWIQA
jgi:hypothetical protein